MAYGKDNSFFTRLILEQKMPEDFGPKKVSAEIAVWDSNGDDFLNLFKTIWVGAGFSEKQFSIAMASYAVEHNRDAVINYLTQDGVECIVPDDDDDKELDDEA